jgi:hypothetical protein
MSPLHIALQDGFAGDEVAIRVDGREVYRKPGVRTDLRISRADAVDVDAGPNAKVEVEARGRTAAIHVDPKATPHLAVSLGPQGEPAFRASAEPFAYL